MYKCKVIPCSLLLGLCFLTGCSTFTSYADGEYRAEFENYDSRGYKDFLEITVEDGVVTSLHYNAVNEDGLLKTEDLAYREEMQASQGIYPERYSQDLVNQYLDSLDIEEVDAVAGATYSSESFLHLFTSLNEQMYIGDTSALFVENIPEK